MSLIWILPSLAMGLLLAMSTGYWQMLAFAVMQAAVQLAARRFRGGPQQSTIDPLTDVRLRGERFVVQGRRLPRLIAFWNSRSKTAVLEYLRQLNSGPPQELLSECYSKRRSGRLLLGLAESNPLELDWSRSPHTLIVGPTGSGKSALLARLLEQLAADSTEVWLFDYKSGETISENAAFCRAFECADSSDQAALRDQWDRLLRRVDTLAPGQKTRLVLVVEELAAALLDRDASAAITQLAAQGRSVGVRMIATNQTASGIPRQLLVNLGNRVVMADADNSERILLGTGGAATLAKSGSTRVGARPETMDAPAHTGVFSAQLVNASTDFDFLAVWSSRGS
ncbi:MAG: AAA family ATPase [Actinomycetales bacterium]|nr:AAA family ATPase [Actinomycetales bacterium]